MNKEFVWYDIEEDYIYLLSEEGDRAMSLYSLWYDVYIGEL